MNSVHPGLFWVLPWLPALAVVAVPVLIHLINMLRHRRVEWAAMEFLLLSQKKNRTWIILKQLLLMLLRMIAVATVVFIVAQPLLQNQWGNLFGSSSTHYVVLLDDSFSMSDRWADTSAFAQAKNVIRHLGHKAAEQVESQTFTLLRFSRARQPDMTKAPVNKQDFLDQLDGVLANLEVSQTGAGPIESLDAIRQLLGESDAERRIVYLISDFRTRDWKDPTEVRKRLLEWNDRKAEIHLVDCVDQARPNLAIASVESAEGIRASSVNFKMEVGVRNFGRTVVRNVTVLLEEDGHARPPVTIAEIPPDRTVKGEFEVNFSTAGEHLLTARLEPDAVPLDNFRYATIHLTSDVPVLLVDGDPDALDARALSIAFAPGGSVRTGFRAQIETPRFLTLKSLDDFQAIYLLNIDRLDKSAVDAVERFAKAGGGVGVFLGDKCQTKFVNDDLYRDGDGFFPLPIKGRTELPVDRLERAPDLKVERHYVFQDFLDHRNTFLESLVILNYVAVPDAWKPPPDSTVRVIAQLRNGAPLAVERSFGKGRVVAFLTTAGPLWNNWRRLPTYVPIVHRLHAYLARRSTADISRQVGTPLELKLDAAEYQPAVRFMAPNESVPTTTVDAVPTPAGPLAVALGDTPTSGYYTVRLTKSDGSGEDRRFAFNVDADEGDLEMIWGPELAAALPGVKCEFEQASAFQYSVSGQSGYNLGEKLLYLLILLLIGEQILAWSASYHPASRRRALAQGGVR